MTSKWCEFEILVMDKQEAEILGEANAKPHWMKSYVDMTQVEAFWDDSFEDTEATTVQLRSGSMITLGVSIEDFADKMGVL